jgi:hypothetical protein
MRDVISISSRVGYAVTAGYGIGRYVVSVSLGREAVRISRWRCNDGRAIRDLVGRASGFTYAANGGFGGSPHQVRRKAAARSQPPASGPSGWLSAACMIS